jgi:transposase-like protein
MARDAREVWAKRVERLADSGLTAKEYAAEIGVNANTLAGWRWRLRSGRGGGEPAAGQAWKEPVAAGVDREATESGADAPAATRAAARKTVTPMKFIELTTVASASKVLFEVVLRSGRTVRVPAGFDAGELLRLVGALEGPRS